MAPERVCLAYSGGLDTSTILRWLTLQGYVVVCFLADCGQEEDFEAVKSKALKLGAERMIIQDVQQELIDELVWPAIQCNAIYEDRYDLLGTSLARPVIARAMVKVAKEFNCTVLSHGCTGKGNEYVYISKEPVACDPTLKVLAPWRLPEFYNRFAGRADLLKFAAEQNIPVSSTPKAPWSMDDNIIHCSYEAGILEQTELEPPKDMWKRTVDPMNAPDEPTPFTVHFDQGVPVKLEVGDKVVTGSLEIFKEANEIGRINGIGRVDIVESRFIGLKSRGCYDTPGLTILRQAHLDIEGLVMDSKVRSIRDRLAQDWSAAIYNGMYFSPERELVEHAIKFSQRQVEGKVSLVAYKGCAYVVGRSSETSNLYSADESSMDTLDMNWTPQDTSGFIAIQSIRLEKYVAVYFNSVIYGPSLHGLSITRSKAHVRPPFLTATLAAATIPPTTRKRKAAEATIPSEPAVAPPSKRIASAALQAQAPPTPATNGMDSEEDFMSAMSSDEEMQEFSDDNDNFEDEFDEEDPDFGVSQDSDSKKRVAYDISYKVYEPNDIQQQQDDMIDEVNMILNLRKEDVAILLRHFRWNKERLIEDYMDKPNKVLEAAGLGANVTGPPKLEAISGFMCDICCEDEVGLETFAMKCGHRYCVNCYRHYLNQKIKEEGEAARIQCPADRCGRILDSKSLDILVTPELSGRYKELLNRTYVEDKDALKWCPAPDCANAVECSIKKKDLDKVVPTVACACGHRFCFGCILTDHQPAPCDLVKLWLKKCADDSETANWISANTKECPRCNSTIEKNGGCNHMTCRKCKHEFCWMCMGLWSEHGTSWYNCNRFEEKSGTDARDAQAKSRVSLERYLHYYNRYANHEQSAKLDKDIYHKTEKKMVQLQRESGMSWIEVQYLNSASQTLQTCRQTLKWTYAFAFYLARNNLTAIFEDNQKDLEMAVEALSEMFEKPVTDLADRKLKVDILDKTSYCNKRRIILLETTAENLASGGWDFIVDLKPQAASATAASTRG
ncbi:hypothetical protein ACHAQH_009687 [Verticillium albo-atrum]